ncbi:restriction endonuclease subunit S [Bacillaceae bacterium IKA-2]|nr:restriction endonuclease subunit S [Bacillaceae bacterium IKA-2]
MRFIHINSVLSQAHFPNINHMLLTLFIEIEDNPGGLFAVQSGAENNGCIGRIDKNYCIKKGYTYTDEPCLTVARTGSAGFVSYQHYGCVVGDSAKILLLKNKEKRSAPIYLFLRTVLMELKNISILMVER